MTRKQAVSQAIAILSQDTKNEQIVEKLQEILNELPMSSWTKKSILDAIENYTIEHQNMLPYERELISKNHMPSNTVIFNLFGISAIREFYAKYFPSYSTKSPRNESPYANLSKEDFQNIFIKNYNRIKSELGVKNVYYHTYDLYRENRTPCAETIMRNCNCEKYEDLLIMCNIKNEKKCLATHVSITYNDDDKHHKEIVNFFTALKKDYEK